jgi:glycosyltransferase involved in cell wall biosynthesis
MASRLAPLSDRGPLRVMFVHTLLPLGGAETLLLNLVRRLDRARFSPQVCCLKQPGPMGEAFARVVPLHAGLLKGKYDLRVLPRLTGLLHRQRIDAVITVGAGDRMFWGRLAAGIARVPVVLTALHSTGWPDTIGRLNRLLTPLTDGFIAVAAEHGRYLREVERFPARKVFVIPNGVDVQRFAPQEPDPQRRAALGLPPDAPVAAIVAALRPEKNHELFLRVAAGVRRQVPDAHFLVVGDGQRRPHLQSLAAELGIAECVHFLGTRDDVPQLLALCQVHVLTSRMEANPVSILEAMACGKPCVAPRVGSIPETVIHETTGLLAPPDDQQALTAAVVRLLTDGPLAQRLGRAARQHVLGRFSLESMVAGYESLLTALYEAKRTGRPLLGWQSPSVRAASADEAPAAPAGCLAE